MSLRVTRAGRTPCRRDVHDDLERRTDRAGRPVDPDAGCRSRRAVACRSCARSRARCLRKIRRIPSDPADIPFGETGVLEGYQRAIMKAEEYIYIEDQYLVSQDIADAIAIRMKEKSDLEVILVLNVKPDIPGYHRKQAALLKQLRDALPPNQQDRLGIFTIWSTDDVPSSKFEIAHIYVHAKVAMIDDKWATVGTANLDGASLNRRQWDLILKAELGERLDSLIGDFKKLGLAKEIVVAILGPLYVALFLIAWCPSSLLPAPSA